jgi:hypothetical protein
MKKILLTLPLLLFVSLFNAQSFFRGALVFDLNTGIEAYHTNNTYTIRRGDTSADTIVRDASASGHATLGMEIGFKKRWGIGVRGKANSFFANVDAVTHQRADIRSTDLLLLLNFHPVITKKFDLILGTDIGFTALKISVDDVYNTVRRGNGAYASIYINPRLYFKRFGINLKTYLPYVSYANLKSNQDQLDQFMITKWKASGVGVSLGIQYRLFKP